MLSLIHIYMAERGLRVIAVAAGTVPEAPENREGARLALLGLVGLADPPREAVPGAIRTCKRAGIRVVMITCLLYTSRCV